MYIIRIFCLQNIGLRLLQTALEDGSPLVRRELVVALQWLIYSFLPNFVNLCRALQEEERRQGVRALDIWSFLPSLLTQIYI